ncbi:MAG: hypothetical protein ACRC3B_18240, partial [Bacteroidia bacterium]
MKKIYTLLAVLAAAGTLSLSAQQTDDGRLHPANANAAQQPGNNVVTSFSCDTTGTTLAAGNGNDGIMFDVTAVQNVRITYIDAKILASVSGKMMVYYKAGTHVGSETTAAAWTFLDTVNVAGAATGYTHLPIYINQVVTAGNSIAFYVTGDGITQAVDYTNGTTVGTVFSQDGFIQIREGTGMSFPFTGQFTSRIPNIVVNYCDVTTIPNCLGDTTTFTSNNGNDGNIFDVTVGAADVTLRRMYCNVNGTGWWHIYYRPGSYVGNATSSAGWILIDSAFVTSAGVDQPTLIPVDMDIYAPAGSTFAFYTTGTTTGADINYTDGTTEGAVFSNDGNISIKEGQGMTFPFGGNFAPRVWNGILEYCLGPLGESEQLSTLPGWSLQVVPNPAADQAQLVITAPQPVQNASVR